MRSSDDAAFVPLAGPAPAAAFRALGMPEPAPDATPAPDPCAPAFEAGRVQGRAEAERERALLADDVATAVAAIGAWRSELRTRYGHALVELALAAARKIVGEELDARPERWHAIVERAVGDLVDRDAVAIRVGPRLAAVLRAHPPGGVDVRILEDATLGDGACRVESRSGEVECGIDAQLAAIADAVGVGSR